MGTSTSAHTTSEIKEHPPSSVSGREQTSDEDIVIVDESHLISNEDEVVDLVMTSDEESSDEEDSDEETDDDSDDDDEQEDEEWIERLKILEDARNLRRVAEFFAHPEKPVVVADATACARCIYSRPSAPEQTPVGEEAEAALVLADAQQMKKLANHFYHPEEPVETHPTACGRNYYSRPSVAEEEDEDDAEERARVLEDAKQLKELAESYLHPENPVVMTEPAVFGRNYFSRASAEEYEVEEEAEERSLILEEMKQMKKSVVDYLHPENPVCADATAPARNYFSRPSAEEYDNEENAEERARVLEEAQELKKLAVAYSHPENPVEMDATVFGRNYFGRSSADDEEEAEERARILEETQKLKELAVDYLHPENPVNVDAAVFGRNYFSRPSADIVEEEDERALIMEDAMELKKLATDYLHPENPIKTDATSFGRNYFSRASEEEEDSEERARILEDAQMLKKLAVDYLHPENPVVPDSTAFARNYFSRPSADNEEEAEERALILNEMQQLKKAAVDYLHPENPVETDATAFGRGYFSRASEEGDSEERARILEDAQMLKKLAVDYLHPENLVVADCTAFARNYFSRPSADDEEAADERALILNEMQQLKKAAVDYLHPENPVKTDATAFGSNYFSRTSDEYEEEAEEKARIMEDALQLKKLAIAYNHPENPVQSHATAFARNYFNRPSADNNEEAKERANILEDAQQLKKLATAYNHPENPVSTQPTAFARNYFSRASADEYDEEGAEERALILEEMKQLKKSAIAYLHPENPVETDATAFGRNYFSRPSAEAYEEEDEAEERSRVLGEAHELKKLASAYNHPENPVSADAATFGRNYFSRPSAEVYDEEQVEERARILEDAQELKKLAVVYAHPENPVEVDADAFGRNYYGRASAEDTEDEERAQVLEDMKQLKQLAVDYLHPETPVVTSDSCAYARNYFTRASAPLQTQDATATKEPKKEYTVPIFPKTLESKGSAFKGPQPKVALEDEKEKDGIHKSPSAIMLFDMGGSDMMY